MQFSNNLSTWREQTIECKNGLTQVDFLDTNPNMFIFQNDTDVTLFMSIKSVPNEKRHEFKIVSQQTTTYGQPVTTNHLFIFNGTEETATIRIWSVQDRFDIQILKNYSSVNELTVAFENTNNLLQELIQKISSDGGIDMNNTEVLGKLEEVLSNQISISQSIEEMNVEMESRMNTKLDSLQHDVELELSTIKNNLSNLDKFFKVPYYKISKSLYNMVSLKELTDAKCDNYTITLHKNSPTDEGEIISILNPDMIMLCTDETTSQYVLKFTRKSDSSETHILWIKTYPTFVRIKDFKPKSFIGNLADGGSVIRLDLSEYFDIGAGVVVTPKLLESQCTLLNHCYLTFEGSGGVTVNSLRDSEFTNTEYTINHSTGISTCNAIYLKLLTNKSTRTFTSIYIGTFNVVHL